MSLSPVSIPHVFLIDDDESFCLAMSKALRRRGFEVQMISDCHQAISLLQNPPQSAVAILDLKMPNMSGLEILHKTPDREVPVIMLTGHGAVPEAVEAMRAGAYSFIKKPVDAAALAPLITQAARLYDEQDVGELIGDSDTIIMLRDVIHQLSSVTEPVLITGEHGTGKEVIARTLHLKSHRSQEPFITVNMASLPHELIGRELFGDVNDLFSKRPHEKKGLFQEIKKGTLFLDEIAEIPLEYQQSLLQILKESEMSSPHSRHDHHFQGRLIVATHKDLSREVAEGRFLEDLFYHLQVLPLHLPPLRDRPEDILPILYVWFDRITQHSLSLSSEAIHILHAHMWPGNVRELVNLTRRIGIFYPKGGDVDARFISRMLKRNPFSASSSSQTLSTQRDQDTAQQSLHSKETDHTQDPLGEDVSLEFIERLHIKRLMSRHTNISHIARILQINRRTLQRKLKAWGMENKEDLKSEPKNQLKVR